MARQRQSLQGRTAASRRTLRPRTQPQPRRRRGCVSRRGRIVAHIPDHTGNEHLQGRGCRIEWKFHHKHQRVRHEHELHTQRHRSCTCHHQRRNRRRSTGLTVQLPDHRYKLPHILFGTRTSRRHQPEYILGSNFRYKLFDGHLPRFSRCNQRCGNRQPDAHDHRRPINIIGHRPRHHRHVMDHRRRCGSQRQDRGRTAIMGGNHDNRFRHTQFLVEGLV